LAEPLWTIGEVAVAAGGALHGKTDVPVNGISIDSRSVAAGDLFVAIKGDTHDGHEFAASALERGAAAVLVARSNDALRAKGAVIQVADDPLLGLERLGRAARSRSKGKVIAVTGSVGKTSTKEMLRVALSASGQTHASAASFNNHWGVPLTLSRFSRAAAYGVFEIGMNHSGEITPLVGMVRPHIAIITAIAASHLGNFKSIDDIAEAKSEIFSGVADNGTAIIPRDSDYYQFLLQRANDHGVRNVVSFGTHADADVRAHRIVLHADCTCVSANVLGDEVTYKLGVPGQHMALNSLAVLAAVKQSGADLARAALALADAAPAKGRGVQEKLAVKGGNILLLDESYNANPASMRAALALLKQLKPGTGGRRIAVLGDMLELGEFSQRLHAELADEIVSLDIDMVFAAGSMMANLWNALPLARKATYADASKGLTEALLKEIRAGDVVMIKGSLGSRMGPLADALRATYQPVKGKTV
jgi:UDP-N-acetylmuramoyl-tripeptide--D-alanyl-D-alanine ligase